MSAVERSADQRRWDRPWEWLPYVLLASCAAAVLVAGLVAGNGGWGPRLITVALAVAAAGWHWWWVSAHPHWPGRLGPMAFYFVVLLLLVWVLIRRDVLFLPVILGCCAMAFVALPGWWAFAGVGATGLTLVATWNPFDPLRQLAVFAIVTLMSSLLGGVLRFMERQSTERSQMIEELERANARLTALAEENAGLQAQLLDRARQAGVIGERERLAREIHDTVAQGLAAIVTQVEAAEESASDPAAVHGRLDQVRTLARDNLAEARRSMQALRPGPLAATKLPRAVEDTAARWSRTSGVATTVTVTGDARRLHAEVEVTALRVVQEALANVAKHAGAGRTGVTVSYLDELLVVDVRDDGVGFTPPGDGFGLTAMRQRVSRLTGRFEVESEPGKGTALSVSLPAIPASEEPEDE